MVKENVIKHSLVGLLVHFQHLIKIVYISKRILFGFILFLFDSIFTLCKGYPYFLNQKYHATC